MTDLRTRRSLAERVTKKTGPSFYRNLYGLSPQQDAPVLRSEEEWRKLPFLHKEHLEAVPVFERSFLPAADIDAIRASSGTSGKPPLFSPQASVSGPYYHLRFHPEARAFLTSVPPPHLAESFLESAGRPPLVVTLDPQDISASVRLSRLTGVDSIFAHSFLIMAIGEEMARQGHAPRIKYVELVGEPSSRSLVEYVRRTFPNAAAVSAYGATEVEGAIGIPCSQLRDEPPREVYHPGPGMFLELLESGTENIREPKAGQESEIIVTAYAGEPFALPLLRYRIGDMVRVVEERCAEHGTWSFTVLGRKDADFIRIPGGMLRADEIERALREEPALVSDRFALRCSDRPTPRGPKPAVTLYLDAPAGTDWERVTERLARGLRVGPSFTYAEGVERGAYLPLRCVPFDETVRPGKRRLLRFPEEE